MIKRIITEDKVDTLAYNRYLNEEQPNERDYNMYQGFKDGASLNDFKKWFEEVKDNKITAIKPNDKQGTITFKMNNEIFDLDFVGDE